MDPVGKILSGGKEYVSRKQEQVELKSKELKEKAAFKKEKLHERIEYGGKKLHKLVHQKKYK